VYFKQDDRFGKPKAYLIFQVLTKEVFASPKNVALANLFELCASDRLGEYAYDGKFERRERLSWSVSSLTTLSFVFKLNWLD
jgi:secreted Zn-dependent insulinase-like peptidase